MACNQNDKRPSRISLCQKHLFHWCKYFTGVSTYRCKYFFTGVSDDDCGGVLPLTDDVMRQLHEKHPEAQDAKLGSILFGPVEEVHDSLYQQIDGEMVREAALRTKGSGSPSGVDANGFKRIITCKSFKKSSANLCDALATIGVGEANWCG